LQRGLTALGADVITYIPHRINDGYGLSPAGLQELDQQGASLVISCDCGTNSVDVVANRPRGQRLIITDHHLPAEQVAAADALLNPHQLSDEYPFKELSGAGVAFKLLQGVLGAAPSGSTGAAVDMDDMVQLVAIGAVADVVPLLGENRVLVRRGLQAMAEAPLAGIAALVEVGLLRQPLTSSTIAYQVAPRINAAGRMDDARLALDLLLADSIDAARPLAELLERHNGSRREATDRAVEEAEEMLAAEGDGDAAIVLADARWSLGLVGLVAGRLVDAHHAPAFVISMGDDEARGSARSVDGFNVVDALRNCEAHLSRYGGHAAAAGFACPAPIYPRLAEALKAYARELAPEDGWSRLMPIDAQIDLGMLTPQSIAELEVLQPFGQGNPAPRFCARGAELKAASVFGAAGEHLRVYLGEGSRVFEGIAWRRGRYVEHYRRAAQRGERLDVLFSPSINRWDGEETVSLELEDVRKGQTAAEEVRLEAAPT
jgi:single-stranded-DNA-specific exonuclease